MPVRLFERVKGYLLFALFLFTSCGILSPGHLQPKREFRGVWIATVANIDWPRSGNDRWAKQQSDYLRLLDYYMYLNFNAVVVQVRTVGDAFYPSAYAPWSQFLTGREGEPPGTTEDPLKWMILQAHQRGFEFHAWLNPYRATFDLDTMALAGTHVFNQHPEWLFRYGRKFYFNPGLPQVQEHLAQIIREVVASYDIDAIHFDDYFYPYKIAGETIPDSLTYRQYAPEGQSLGDWRRSNIDTLIRRVHQEVRKEKPWVQFGVSPFGVWKNKATDPGGSDTQAGQTTYEDLYADPLKWMHEGWIDYIVPQVYWSMDLPVASHDKIVRWWADHRDGTNLYMGNAAYKIRDNADKAWDRKKELPDQLRLARDIPQVQGNVFFSARSLLDKNHDVSRFILKHYYKYPAIPPVFPATDGIPEGRVVISQVAEEPEYLHISFNPGKGPKYRYALVYASRNARHLSAQRPGQIIAKIYIGGRNGFNLGKNLIRKKGHVAITFLDRFGVETGSIVLNLK